MYTCQRYSYIVKSIFGRRKQLTPHFKMMRYSFNAYASKNRLETFEFPCLVFLCFNEKLLNKTCSVFASLISGWKLVANDCIIRFMWLPYAPNSSWPSYDCITSFLNTQTIGAGTASKLHKARPLACHTSTQWVSPSKRTLLRVNDWSKQISIIA